MEVGGSAKQRMDVSGELHYRVATIVAVHDCMQYPDNTPSSRP
ncbi:MAG: hypothetical protein JWQ11_1673 [Rhizobacter sp.]|nr:hypothetical protein [Rhizobacter sp.]